jgi:hypothetical protein
MLPWNGKFVPKAETQTETRFSLLPGLHLKDHGIRNLAFGYLISIAGQLPRAEKA